jgi:hypothetical protein
MLCLISNSGDGQWVRKNSRTAFSYSVGVIVLTLSGLSPIFHIAPYAAQPACMQWRKTISGSHMPTDRQPELKVSTMTPTEYEKAVLEFFRTHWPSPEFEIKHNIRLLGRKTKGRRQIDAGIFGAGQSEPIMIVEAKRHNRAIDAGIAGATIALVQDVGAIPTVMVSTSGFSVAAKNHLEAEEIGHLTINAETGARFALDSFGGREVFRGSGVSACFW